MIYLVNTQQYSKETIMPFGNGTGPMGFGPRSGRGKGKFGGFRYNKTGFFSFRSRRNNWLFGLTSSLFLALLKDLGNPRGFLRNLTSNTFLGNKNDNSKKQSRVVRNAEYEIVEEKENKENEKELKYGSPHNSSNRISEK
jgi:hypothetical protein